MDLAPSEPDLRDLRALAMVARTRSLRDAAEAIAVSQTTVSRQIAGLETCLRCTLVRRGWSGAELTQEGEIVARHAQAILDAVALCDAALPPVRRPPLLPRLRLRDLAAVAVAVGRRSTRNTNPNMVRKTLPKNWQKALAMCSIASTCRVRVLAWSRRPPKPGFRWWLGDARRPRHQFQGRTGNHRSCRSIHWRR